MLFVYFRTRVVCGWQTHVEWLPSCFGVTTTSSSNMWWLYWCQWTSAMTLDFNLWAHKSCFYFRIWTPFHAPGLTSLQATLVYWHASPQTVIDRLIIYSIKLLMILKIHCWRSVNIFSWRRRLLGILVKQYSSALISEKHFFNQTSFTHWSWKLNWTRLNDIFETLQLMCIKPSRGTWNYWSWARYDSIVFYLFLSPLPSYSLLLVVWKVMEFVTEQPYWLLKLKLTPPEANASFQTKIPLNVGW